ncbi:hypothetical protein HanLR1_Chr17g0647691 [Helianthus annuus]|nr:hypothetical protein HanHA89_Chr17g0688291 [Helianthus annuus]KAJ0630851.1 hypothetical protein HanLR1_Chr17g0647691 [Helianthus annuus]
MQKIKEDNESTSSSYAMESAAYYSPSSGSKTQNIDQLNATTTDDQSMQSENSSYSLEASSGDKTVEDKTPNLENKSPSNMKVLEDRIIALKLEIEELNGQKGEHGQVYKRHDEFHKGLKEISNFQYQLEFKEKEGEVLKKIDECETFFNRKIEESMGRVLSLETEVDSLRVQNKNLSLQKEQELESLRIRNEESEFELGEKTREALVSVEMLESLTEKLQQKTENEAGLVEERDGLKRHVKDLEIIIESINDENRMSKNENENQRGTISELREKLEEKDSRISALELEIEGVEMDLSDKVKSLEQKDKSLEIDKMEIAELREKLQEKDSQIKDLSNKIKSLEIDKMELEGKNDDLVASLEQRDMEVNKSNNEAYSSFRSTVKKMGEMVDEFRKKSEDSFRILGRRIRVAEQLHNETREWYEKTREQNEQDRKDCELALHSIKIIMSMVSDTLSVSETFGLRFVECCEAFTNRVSKVSCEINYVKDWMKRKNAALVQLKQDFDEHVVQLDEKESEILVSRQKVLKLKSKLRDLEKTVKEDDEKIIVLKEEKREAIRQLCVWIDYHRGRSDFFKKTCSELVARYQKPG